MQSGIALSYFKDRMRPARFVMLEPDDTPKTARLDAGGAHKRIGNREQRGGG